MPHRSVRLGQSRHSTHSGRRTRMPKNLAQHLPAVGQVYSITSTNHNFMNFGQGSPRTRRVRSNQHLMIRSILLAMLTMTSTLLAGPTNSILFVTQPVVPGDFTTIGSVFGNHRATPDSCGRGGDLYIRYP